MNIRGKVLIIDDDTNYSKLAQMWLQKAGYEVLIARDGTEGMRSVFSSRPNLVILDIMMPKMDGWEICRRIREMSDIPVLFVSIKAEKSDRIKGFGFGADDFIPKPVEFSELVARVQAVLRRTATDAPSEEQSSFRNGEVEVEWKSRQVYVRGVQVKLSPTEFRILSCLIKNRGWIVTHEQLLEKGWGPNYIGDKSFVKLYIRYLRQKVEADPRNPQLILTERGVGYRFCFESDKSEQLEGENRDKAPSFS